MNIENILEEREKTHGSFRTHAFCTQQLKFVLKDVQKMADTELSYRQQEALDMICHKLGRIVAGNPDTQDHWDDIAGYSTLVSRSLKS